jgi:hypothetical protein
MRKAEAEADPGTAVLVHTDLTVVDEQLGVIDESLWKYQGIQPELDSLERLLIQNCVTGCTAMINRSLREKADPIPPEAVMHDWWLTLVASCFGRIVCLPIPTLLYRQHGRNDTGAKRQQHGTIDRTITAYHAFSERGRAVRRIGAQGEAFLRRYRGQLTPVSRTLIQGAVDHLVFRTSLAGRRRYRRVGPISREVISGRYSRFSKGLSSALRDVIL